VTLLMFLIIIETIIPDR